MSHPVVMMRRSALLAVGKYREFSMMEDFDLFLRLAEHGRLTNLPEVLLKYRMHSEQQFRHRRPSGAGAPGCLGDDPGCAAKAQSAPRTDTSRTDDRPTTNAGKQETWGWWALGRRATCERLKSTPFGAWPGPRFHRGPGSSRTVLSVDTRHSMDINSDGSPLSIGYFSPGWPLDAFPNGVVSYVVDMDRRFRQAGHRVTVVASEVTGGPYDTTLYNPQKARLSRSLWQRVMDGVGYRLAPEWTSDRINRRVLMGTIRRAVAERDIQLFEMEEAFGWPWWVRRAISVPVCVRLHGPWFLNSPALGLPEDDMFRRRVIAEGRAIADADAVTAPSHDVLERTRSLLSHSAPRGRGNPPADSADPRIPAVAARGLRPKPRTIHRQVRPPQGGRLDDRSVWPGSAATAPVRASASWDQTAASSTRAGGDGASRNLSTTAFLAPSSRAP